MKTRLIAFATVLVIGQSPTPSQLVTQLEEVLKQLKAAIAGKPGRQVSTSAELLAALKTGGAIEAAPGTYVGNFIIAVNGTTLNGPETAILQPLDKLEPTLVVKASDVTVGTLTVHNGAPDRETVVVGSWTAKTVAEQPHRVTLKTRVLSPSGFGHRGYSLHGVDITLDGATCLGFLERFRDSQCVLLHNGPGPYTIVNGTFEGSGENLLAGGADPTIPGVVPSKITIRNNLFRKPQAWREPDKSNSVKNLLELKNADEVLIEGNTFDGNWNDAQAGHPIVFTVRNQDGACTWCIVDDVVFRNNIIKNTPDGFAVNILGSDSTHPSAQTRRITIDRNLFVDSPAGFTIANGVTEALVITNNTLPAVTNKIFSFGAGGTWTKALTPLTFSRNVLPAGMWGVTSDGTMGFGLPSLLQFATVVEWNGNVIEHHAAPDRIWTYPAGTGNVYVAAGGLKSLLDPKTFKLMAGTAGY